MVDIEAFVDILKERLTTEQLEDILQYTSDCIIDGYCPICYEEDVPVDEQGKEIEGDDVSMAYEFSERHTEDCPITWIEKVTRGIPVES